MDGERTLAVSHRLPSLAAKFHDKQYRDSYVAAHARRVLAEQMRNFRGNLSQADYAVKIGKQKTVVGRLENPAYGGWSLRTMLEVAREENVAVIVRFVDFPTFLGFTDDMSDEALCPKAYEADKTNDFAEFSSHAGSSVDPASHYFDTGYTLSNNPGSSLGAGMTMSGPHIYNNVVFGSQTYGVGSLLPTFTSARVSSEFHVSPIFVPAESNAGMRDLVRRKNKEIFELYNEVSNLRAELARMRANLIHKQEADPHYLMRPQSQRNVVPFPNAA